jgi:hypothetical protein
MTILASRLKADSLHCNCVRWHRPTQVSNQCFDALVDATERIWGGAELPWGMKPERSCSAVTLMTAVAFVTTVLVGSVDVYAAHKQAAFGRLGGGDRRALGTVVSVPRAM